MILNSMENLDIGGRGGRKSVPPTRYREVVLTPCHLIHFHHNKRQIVVQACSTTPLLYSSRNLIAYLLGG